VKLATRRIWQSEFSGLIEWRSGGKNETFYPSQEAEDDSFPENENAGQDLKLPDQEFAQDLTPDADRWQFLDRNLFLLFISVPQTIRWNCVERTSLWVNSGRPSIF
jgi:hypothetical protein